MAKKDIYQEITNQIISDLEKGAKAICVIFYKKITVEDKETEEEKKPKVFSLIWRQVFYGTSFKAPTGRQTKG